ncbi:unnamed protein product [Urochloa humidicola]
MAALRSALMSLAHRSCGNFGSKAAASMVGRGLGALPSLRPAATRTPVLPSLRPAATRTPALPSLRPTATRNLEGWRCFSTGAEGAAQSKPLLMKHKAESILRMWWQRSMDSVKNVTKDSTVVATTISFMASFCLLRLTFFSSADIRTKNVQIHHSNAFASSTNASGTNTRTKRDYVRTNATLESPLPISLSMIPSFQGIYISSLRPRRGHAVTSMKTKDRS